MRIFVTGASGFIGSKFCALAVEHGHEVVALVRPASAGRVVSGVVRVYGSLPYDVPEKAVAGCGVIVHLAAITTGNAAAESQAVNAYGTEAMIRLAERHGTGFVFVSTQSAHGGNSSAYAVTKRRGEELLKESELIWAIVRPGLVYGPGEYGLFARMRGTVRKLPVMPLLGGGRALVQPIHVDDLSKGLLSIATDLQTFGRQEFNLGDAQGVTLREFLAKLAMAQKRSARAVSIPLAPVKLVVGAGEKLGLPLPISMDNLKGLETVERMDTDPDLIRLGLTLRDLDEGLADSELPAVAVSDSRIQMLLVGAGKIGIVHGLQLLNNSKVRLVGIVEPNPKSAKLYKSMGFRGPYFSSVEKAMSVPDRPEAVVIATPAFTHLDIARKCLDAGLHILSEKPLSVNINEADEWRHLRTQYPDHVIHSGYMAAQFPHLLTAYRASRTNKLGHIYRANAVALQTHITSAEPVRWEMLKEKAGGGAMINFGCHVASIMFRLLGWPEGAAKGWQWPIYSSEVEDALVAKFSIKSTQCTLLVSWSVPGYARPYNMVELVCEHGVIRVENSQVSIIRDGVVERLETQLDYGLDFNMAPDYTGGGFSLEHEAFSGAITAVRQGRGLAGYLPEYMPPVEVPEALRLESWIYELYDNLKLEKPTRDELQEFNGDKELLYRVLEAGSTK